MIRGAGLAAALIMKSQDIATAVSKQLRERGFLMVGGASAVCCRSSYAVTAKEITDLLKAIDEILTEMEK